MRKEIIEAIGKKKQKWMRVIWIHHC